MIGYIVKRLLGLVPTFIGITVITFVVIHLAPGKITDQSMTLRAKVSLEAREKLEKLYNLDKPIHIQYVLWVRRLAVLDFGNSFVDQRPVIEKIGERLPVTLMINILSMALIFLVAIPIGIASAIRRGSFFDRSSTLFVFVGFATP
ncbi:MAG: ABC transporter permease, partial [Omnitrophica bacterium]|nr:ABC transporter permease [Candidatus Omnitrophota bacterium]